MKLRHELYSFRIVLFFIVLRYFYPVDYNVNDISFILVKLFTQKSNCSSIIAHEGVKKVYALRGCPVH